MLAISLVAAPGLGSGGATATTDTHSIRSASSTMATQNGNALPALSTQQALATPATNTAANDTVALNNVTAAGVCTDYKHDTATFEISNHDDDTAQVTYHSPAGEGGSGKVAIPPGESIRVDNMDTTGVATGLESAAITLFIENAPAEKEQGINYPSNRTPCGNATPTTPEIMFTNQTTFAQDDFAVMTDKAALPQGGFIVFANESEAIVDNSYYIGQGTAEQVDANLYEAFENADEGDQVTLTATLYRDTDGDGTFDPTVDEPYKNERGINTSATATVTYGGYTP